MAAGASEAAVDERPKTFEDLLREVHGPGRCTFCLICLDACAREGCDAASIRGNTFRYTASQCRASGMCYISCPEVESLESDLEARYGIGESEIGRVLRVACLTTPGWPLGAKGSGPIQSILHYLFEKDEIDGAVVPAPPEGSPSGHLLIRPREELVIPARNPLRKPQTVRFLRDLWRSSPKTLRLALVTAPCQVRMVRKMQANRVPPGPDIKLIVGEFCYATLSNARWRRGFYESALGSYGRAIKSVAIQEDVHVEYRDGSEARVNPDELALAFDSSCLSCLEYANPLADLSIGTVGSPEGFQTLLVRTKEGVRALNGTLRAGYLVDWTSLLNPKDTQDFDRQLTVRVESKVRDKRRLCQKIGRKQRRPSFARSP